MNSKSCKKVLVRNCEQKVTKDKSNVKRDYDFVSESNMQQLEDAYRKATREPIISTSPSNYLNKPVLNSTLAIFENVKAKQNKDPCLSKSNKEKLLAETDVDVTKKLNFPVEAHLYKDLVSLNISNSCLTNEYNIPTSSKPAPFTKHKHDPVLDIENFVGDEEPNFIAPQVTFYNAPTLKPNRMFDMSYIQRMYDFEYET